MGLTISLNRVSFLSPVRNNIFYEIETSSTGLYNTGLGVQSTGGGRSPFFSEQTLKTTENLLWVPLFAPSFEKVWMRPPVYCEKN